MSDSDTNPIIDEEISSPVNEEVTNPSSTKQDEEIIQKLQEQLARSQADYANLVRRSREESAQV
jgi:molecular chaperone GrpE (heat shock protein)